MTLEHARNSFRRQHDAGVHRPRLRLKPETYSAGEVDGGWWPRSDDLMTELSDLLTVLSFRLRAIDRVTYNLNEWADAPAMLFIGRRAVRLNGNRGQPPNTIEVLDANRNKIVLLVVSSHTAPDDAHAIVMAAAAPDDASSVDALLMTSEQDRESRTRSIAAEKRWNSQRRAERSTSPNRHRSRR